MKMEEIKRENREKIKNKLLHRVWFNSKNKRRKCPELKLEGNEENKWKELIEKLELSSRESEI